MSEVERFLFLAIGLGAVMVLMAYVLRESQFSNRLAPRTLSTGLRTMLAFAYGGFLIHYWLPAKWREPFWWGLSISGALYIADPVYGGAALAATALFYVLLILPVPFVVRAVLTIGVVFGVVYTARYEREWARDYPLWFTLFGGIFMFRLGVYLLALNRRKDKRPGLAEHLRYFVILPNYVMPHFPIIDIQVLNKAHDRRERYLNVQEGIRRILNAAIQLGVFLELQARYPKMFSVFYPVLEQHSQSFTDFLWVLVTSLCFFLPISGAGHLVIGIMLVYGYNLPRTSNNYALATSPLDYWQRANIYWMAVLRDYIYFPAIARLRKINGRFAVLSALVAVFVLTWAMHMWLRGWLTDMRLFVRWTSEHWVYLGLGGGCVAQVIFGWVRVATLGHPVPAQTAAGRAAVWATKVFLTGLWMALLTTLLRTTTMAEFLRICSWWS